MSDWFVEWRNKMYPSLKGTYPESTGFDYEAWIDTMFPTMERGDPLRPKINSLEDMLAALQALAALEQDPERLARLEELEAQFNDPH